jgi:hypothetical protein
VERHEAKWNEQGITWVSREHWENPFVKRNPHLKRSPDVKRSPEDVRRDALV